MILVALVISFVTENFKPTTAVQLGSGLYQLSLANDEATRQQGLSGVKSLPVNGGLLMDFKTDDRWGIWMKDMRIPLDIIWLNKTKRVVYIKENVSPDLGTSEVMQPKELSRYVIELPAGSAKEAGIKLGQTAVFTVKGSD